MNEDIKKLLEIARQKSDNYDAAELAADVARAAFRNAADLAGEAIALEKYGIRRGQVVTYQRKEGYQGKIVTRRMTAESFSGDEERLIIAGRVVNSKGERGEWIDVHFYFDDKLFFTTFVKSE